MEDGDLFCDPTGEHEEKIEEWCRKQAWRWPGLILARSAAEMCPGYWPVYHKGRIVEKVRSRIRFLRGAMWQQSKDTGLLSVFNEKYYHNLIHAQKWNLSSWGMYPAKGVLP